MPPPVITTNNILNLAAGSWAGGASLVLTYSVPVNGSTWTAYSAGTEPFEAGYGVVSATTAEAFINVMELFDSLVGATFNLVDDLAGPGQIRIAYNTDPVPWGRAYLPNTGSNPAVNSIAGDVWLSAENVPFDVSFAPGTYDLNALMHEVGHALGLRHTFEGGSPIPAQYDNYRYSIMSYTHHTDEFSVVWSGTPGGGIVGDYIRSSPITPMLFDIYALQNLYGADPNTRSGGTTYTFDADAPHLQTIYDAGGVDLWDLSAQSRPSVIDLEPGSHSSVNFFSISAQIEAAVAEFGEGFRAFITDVMTDGPLFTWTNNVAIAYGVIIENVYLGSGNDTATGNSAANELRGNNGNDWLSGAGGADILIGGDGADTLTGGAGVDAISGGIGDDIINYNFGDGVDAIDGGGGTDRIVTQGNAGGETLDAHWNGTSFTFFKGGAVTSIEQAIADMGGGVDWLRQFNSTQAVTINLATGVAAGFISIANIENAWGSAFNDTLTGSSVANILRGAAGDDTIDGGDDNDTLIGEDGLDTLIGGNGADTFYGLSGVDTINGGEGNDIIYYSFGEGVDVIDGGNGVDTIICQGNSGAETLEVAWNGTGFTFFKGGAVTSIEQAQADMGVGGDWLRYTASTVGISIDLGANTATGFISLASVENAAGGGFDDTIIGSGVANNLIGNAGADVINGAGGNDTINGGAGADTITGGAGGDTMIGGADADVFVFATGSGIDTIVDFDANPTGGQDLLDISGYGITGGNFGARVAISDQGANTLVTIDGTNTILLTGVTGDGANVITQADFLLA